MPSPESGKQWPALSPAKKTPSSTAGRRRVREPVALVAHRGDAEPCGDVPRRRLDVVARLVGADADALLARGGHGPGVAVADERAVDPDVEVGAAAVRMHLEAARDLRLGRLDVRAGAEHAAPAERVDDERRGQVAAVGPDGVLPVRALDLRRSRSGRRRTAPTAPRRASGSRSEDQLHGSRKRAEPCGVWNAMQGSSWRIAARDAHGAQPRGGRRAGGRLALADLVAVDHEHVRAAARELARDGQPGEGGAADEHVGRAAPAACARRRAASRAGSPAHRPDRRARQLPGAHARAAAEHVEVDLLRPGRARAGRCATARRTPGRTARGAAATAGAASANRPRARRTS